MTDIECLDKALKLRHNSNHGIRLIQEKSIIESGSKNVMGDEYIKISNGEYVTKVKANIL
jgi:hypothetical protein